MLAGTLNVPGRNNCAYTLFISGPEPPPGVVILKLKRRKTAEYAKARMVVQSGCSLVFRGHGFFLGQNRIKYIVGRFSGFEFGAKSINGH